MKAIFEFNDEEELDGIKRTIHALDAFLLLHDIDNEIRSQLKYGETKDNGKTLERVREMIYEKGLLEMIQ
jgi:hypothetical protein